MGIVYVLEKGDPLNAVEFDGNFRDIDDRLQDVENNPPEAVSLDHFVIEGTLLTIYLTDGSTHGPFVLPVAQWRWVGEWAPATTFLPGDILTESGNIYFVRVQHVSDDVFDPGAFSIDGFLYILILSKSAQPYDIGFYWSDYVLSGVDILAAHVAVRPFTILPGMLGSQAYLQKKTTTSPIVLPVYRGSDIIGSITFTPGDQNDLLGGQYGVFETTDPDSGVAIAIRDIIAIGQPYDEDETAKGLVVTIVGTTPGL